MKVCSKCGQVKDESEFRKGRNQCKECRRAYGVIYLSTPEGKSRKAKTAARYHASPKGKACRSRNEAKYRISPKGKARKRMESVNPDRIEKARARAVKNHAQKTDEKLIKENPGLVRTQPKFGTFTRLLK